MGRPENSYVKEFTETGSQTILVEPHPNFAAALVTAYKDNDLVHVVQAAIVHPLFVAADRRATWFRMREPWTIFLHLPIQDHQSSYLPSITAPAVVEYGASEATDPHVNVPAIPFSWIDNGEIDVLNLDCEGSEWNVLAGMTSRPKMIYVEMRAGLGYVNPNAEKIRAWMTENDYALRPSSSLPDPAFNELYVRK